MDEEFPDFSISELREIEEIIVVQQSKDKDTSKKRFATLETKDYDELLDGAKAKRTKYNTKFSLSVFDGK